jgi:hypothetical protein
VCARHDAAPLIRFAIMLDDITLQAEGSAVVDLQTSPRDQANAIQEVTDVWL